MGISFSTSGSGGQFSHPRHSARFKRVTNESPPSPCGMCPEKVDFNAAVYRCSEPGCSFILHDTCYRRPETINRHFAHPQQQRLTLTPVDGHSCTLCAQRLNRPTFAYSCTHLGCACGGFHAHPRCCALPQNLSSQHEHGRLVLLPPSSGRRNSNVGERRRRTCIKCGNTAATGARAPWSYQCLKCDHELCLACLLGDDHGAVRCCCCCCSCNQCYGVDPAAVHRLGQLVGVFFCGFLSIMGCPSIPTQPYPGDLELATTHRR